MIRTQRQKLEEKYAIRPAVMNDAAQTAELFNAHLMKVTGKAPETEEGLLVIFESPGFNLDTDTQVVFSPTGEMIAYIEVWASGQRAVHPEIWGCVHPEYENQGIGTYLLNWAEKRASQALDQVPTNLRVSITDHVIKGDQQSEHLLKKAGWQLARHYFHMRIDMDSHPPIPQWPEGIKLRKYKHPEDAEAIYRADEEAFQDHFGYISKPFEEGFKEFQHFLFEDEAFDPDLWFLAMNGKEIAGLCIGRKWGWEDLDIGWVRSLAVRRPWRRRGIGLALLQHIFGEFYERGVSSVGLGVDASSLTGATGLYEKAGMYTERRIDRYEKELRPGVELAVQELDES
jgi:ribosomal protein S18 acetylase RimI-like enzyme